MIACLRDLLRAVPGLKPVCFYCGARATQIDHSKPRSARGGSTGVNLKPACARCNSRKGARTRSHFRNRLLRLEEIVTGAKRGPLRFYGEGARGPELRRLRGLLSKHLRNGEVLTAEQGETYAPLDDAQRERNRERKARRNGVRWPGRFTFAGTQALKALAQRTGCSYPVVERFVMGSEVLQADALATAATALGLDVEELRNLKPQVK